MAMAQTASRDIVSESNDYWKIDTPVVTAAPLTMATWFYADTVGVVQRIMIIGDTATTTHFFHLYGHTTGAKINCAVQGGGTLRQSSSTASYTAGKWHHVACTTSSAANRVAWLDGVAGTANTNSVTPAGLDNTVLGAAVLSSTFDESDGKLAHAAIWSVALDEGEIKALAAGVVPTAIRPGSLVGYWPLTEPAATDSALDRSGNGNDMTDSGDPAISTLGPPVFNPGAIQ